MSVRGISLVVTLLLLAHGAHAEDPKARAIKGLSPDAARVPAAVEIQGYGMTGSTFVNSQEHSTVTLYCIDGVRYLLLEKVLYAPDIQITAGFTPALDPQGKVRTCK